MVDLRYCLPVLLVCTVLYVLTVSSSVSVVDNGTFMMVCDAGGIAHPPGFPLTTLLCHPMLSLPFEGAIPGNLFSTVFAVFTLCALFVMSRLIKLSALESALAVGLFGVSAGFWSQSIVLEVYTLNSFLFVCMMICCIRFHETENRYWLVGGAFILGLALSNHWPLIVLSSVCLLPFLFWKTDPIFSALRSPVFLMIAFTSLALGLSPYLSLFTKAGNPMTTIGEVHSFADLWLYASRGTYQDTFLTRSGGWLGLLWWLPLNSINQFGYLGWVLIPLGALRSWFDISRPVAVSLILLWCANCLLLTVLSNAQFSELFKIGLLSWIALALVSCSVWMTLGIRYIWSLTQGREVLRHVTAVLIFAVVAIQSYASLGVNDSKWVESYNRLLLESLEDNALLIVAGDSQTGPLGYLHHVQGLRPDIELRQQHNMLFSNRLAHPRTDSELQAGLLEAHIKNTDRPVYTITDMGLPAMDYGMYMKLGEGGFGFDARLDSFMSDLMLALEADAIREPFIRIYLNNVVYEYARAVVTDAIVSEGLSIDQQVRVSRVSQTVQGKIWTLHHLVNGGGQAFNPELLIGLLTSGEQQINELTPKVGARKFFLIAGDAYRELLGSKEEALIRYKQARRYDVYRETCEHLEEKGLQILYEPVECSR